MARATQFEMENHLMEYVDTSELYEEISSWLSTDTMCEFLEDFARNHDIPWPWDDEG